MSHETQWERFIEWLEEVGILKPEPPKPAPECTIEDCDQPSEHPGQPCEFCHKELGLGG